MIVQKFGGSSLGLNKNFKQAIQVISESSEKKIIVLSAISGITNLLEKAYFLKISEKYEESFEALESIRNRFIDFANSLFSKPGELVKIQTKITDHFNRILKIIGDSPNKRVLRKLLAYGEIITAEITVFYLKNQAINCQLIHATDFMRIDKEREPDYYYIKENLEKIIYASKNTQIFITQGFICKNFIGEIDNLNRGGSDKSATIIAKVLNSDRVEIWSDRDGILNNDPRYVDTTYALDKISYEEAEELAAFGAKILHPSSIKPAKEGRIPMVLKNTFNPYAKGTVISSETRKGNVKAVAAKDDVTVIKITSGDMLLAYGFLSKIFQVFEYYKTPVDMVATSEVTVALSIDDTTQIEPIIYDLNKFGKTEIFKDQSILAVVGNIPPEDKGITFKIFESLKEIPIRMISYGAGSRSITVLINGSDKIKALNLLNDQLFFRDEHTENQFRNTQHNDSRILV